MIKQHIYRFTKTGKPSARFFKNPKVKEKRIFPKSLHNYVSNYFDANKHIISFV